MKADEHADEYFSAHRARTALLNALAAYDAAGLPPSDAVRGNLVMAGLLLAPFSKPPAGYDGEEIEGPEDWFGVL